ncbi:MAG: response regulator transcription factor [Lachnospiraceae bacterium]|nr:response regulator transcription factor [Lachnospiraceae bacterium]
MKILLAEDEAELSRALKTIIEHEGFLVDLSSDGEEAESKAKENIYDCIILDIMMPKKNGIDVLRGIRSRGDRTPVLMLTAKAEIEDRVEGLDSGADDYLTKPFAMKELLARIRSMTRRSASYNQKKLSFGNACLDMEIFELKSINSIRLANKEAELLSYLVQNRSKDCTEDELFEHIWNGNEEIDQGIVWVYVSYLKKKLQAVKADSEITGDRKGPYKLILR